MANIENRWYWNAKIGTQPGYRIAIKGHPSVDRPPAVGEVFDYKVGIQYRPGGRLHLPHGPWHRGRLTAMHDRYSMLVEMV